MSCAWWRVGLPFVLLLATVAILLLLGGACARVGTGSPKDSQGPGGEATFSDGVQDVPVLDLADGSLLVDKQPGDSGAVLGTWVAISKGTFTMGSPPDEPCRDSDEAQHLVNLTHDFELQETEVTQGQFFALMDYNPSANSCSPSASCPVETVSWHESAAYCNELSSGTGKDQCYTCTGSGASVSCQQATAYSGQNLYNCPGYRLPTEAEWEYAYRAGTITAYYIGASDPAVCNLCSLMDANADMIGWYCANSANNAHPVKQKQPNAWGLHDVLPS